jgi:hypothetical protein
MDEAQDAVLNDGRLWPLNRGAASGLGARFEVHFSLACRKRLTEPRLATQDAEKTAVFLYSKLKQGQR